MLRTISKVVIPLSVRICNFDIQRVVVRGIVRWERGHVHPKLLQVLNPQEGRKMCTAITDEMHLPYEDFVKLKESENVIIIDVRNPDELRESGKIEGSINIPLKDLSFALEYLSVEEFQHRYGIPRPKLDAPLIFHCRSGARSLKALQIALDLGYKKAEDGRYYFWLSWWFLKVFKTQSLCQLIYPCIKELLQDQIVDGYETQRNAKHYKGGFSDWQEHNTMNKN